MLSVFNDIKKFRKRFEIDLPIDPNKISGLSILISFLIAYLIIRDMFLLSAILLFITLILDLLDGAIARARNLDSRQGQVIDWATDRISEAVIFSPLFLIYPISMSLVILNIFLNFITITKKIDVVIPLRHLLLLWLIFMVVT